MDVKVVLDTHIFECPIPRYNLKERAGINVIFRWGTIFLKFTNQKRIARKNDNDFGLISKQKNINEENHFC